jgi:hypothetical protein
VELFNLRDEILAAHSKAQCDRITAWVGDDPERFNKLFDLLLMGDYKIMQRASWPLSNCVIAHPWFIKKRLGELIKILQLPAIHDAVKRNSVRVLQEIDIPKKYQGEVMNICFNFLESPVEAVAIKAFSLTILGNLAKQYPAILPEIKLLIETQLPNQTAAFVSRAKRLLKETKDL